MPNRTFSTLILIGLLAFSAQAWAGEKVSVFAASSTKPVFDALAPILEQQGITLSTVHAGSSTLARQIEQGAPADIYVSANVRWMEYLTDHHLVIADSKRILANNQLILITGAKLAPAPKMVFGKGYPLASILGDERLAIADPDHVPAGLYAREALNTLNLWAEVENKLARTLDVTSALMMVARGQVPLGIVYASDVGRSAKIRTFAPIPQSSHSPITYPAAILKGRDRTVVKQVMEMLIDEKGRAAFIAAGFEAPS